MISIPIDRFILLILIMHLLVVTEKRCVLCVSYLLCRKFSTVDIDCAFRSFQMRFNDMQTETFSEYVSVCPPKLERMAAHKT